LLFGQNLRRGYIMYYKDDWSKAKKRLKAFWAGEKLDRPCVAVFAPRENSSMPPFPELTNGPWLGGLDDIDENDRAAIKNWWIDPKKHYERMIAWFENTYFGGEAVPATYLNWGAMAEASFFGSPPKFNKSSVWYPPVIDDWEEWEWQFDKSSNKYWNTILEIMEYYIEKSEGRYFVGMPELGSAGDILSLMRGAEELSMDLIRHPEKVKESIDIIAQTWVELHEELYKMTVDTNDGGSIIPWMSLWAPGRTDQIACDFSSLISPKMFKKFFVPEFKTMGSWCDYGTYHLDGPDAIKNHLDVLLDIEEIKAIQFTPGKASPPTYTEEYIPKYKKIQESGKNLILLADIEEIKDLMKHLSPDGLFIHTYADSEDEADQILEDVKNWS